MSRRTQDIPIRPRYGLSDVPGEPERPTTSRARRSTSSSSKDMGSSYSEIPFLAQYAGAVPDHALERSKTSQQTTVANAISLQQAIRAARDEGAYDDDNESLEENSNSKDSSGDVGGDGAATAGTASKKGIRPSSLQCDSSFPYELEGGKGNEGEMRHFVADNLEEKLRKAPQSPQRKSGGDLAFASETSTPSLAKGILTHHFLQSQGPPQIDGNVLSDIEIEAQYLATSVDTIMENLGNLLHSISSITADNVEVHKNAVNKLTDCMDANIKCMYTIMAKTEEISKFMKPTEQLSQRIREIKRLVDMLDNNM